MTVLKHCDEPMYLISIVNVDTCDNRYICDTIEKANELFDELRKECIADCRDSISRYKEDGMDHLVEHEEETIEFLENMKPGDNPPWCCDRPSIRQIPFIRARGPLQQAPAISRHLGTIRASSDVMKYLSDEEIITRCLSMMAGMFSAQNDRRKEPAVFFDE